MDTPFDITQKPLSVAELEQEREALMGQIDAAESRFRRNVIMIVLLSGLILTAVIVGNAHWDWLPWSDFVSDVAFGVAFGVVVGAGAGAGAGAVVGALVVVGPVVGAVVGAGAIAGAIAVGGAVVGAVEWFSKQIDRREQAKASLAALSEADREACLDIKDWLEDDTILQYRDWVQAEGRVFTVGEVKAMREHWESCSQHQADAERAAAIDAACREVYVENLTRSELKG